MQGYSVKHPAVLDAGDVMRTLPLLSLLAVGVVGCPHTNSVSDAPMPPDAFEPELIPGVPDDAQLCELTMEQLRLYFGYTVARAGGTASGPDGFACLDGAPNLEVWAVERSVAATWAACDMPDLQRCGRPAAANAHCIGSTIQRCLMGESAATIAEGRSCGVSAPPGCVIDRSRAVREP